MREVLMNVLINAYQAILPSEGYIRMSIKAHTDTAIEINIQDSGKGISAKDLTKIFEPFFTTKAKGTGLGLSICNEIIHLHQGRLDIQSPKEQGVCVSIILPIQRKCL
jgi:signal transduction histidine kinase